jgi:hypothetical protein
VLASESRADAAQTRADVAVETSSTRALAAAEAARAQVTLTLTLTLTLTRALAAAEAARAQVHNAYLSRVRGRVRDRDIFDAGSGCCRGRTRTGT